MANQKTIISLAIKPFKALCVVSASFMVGYWIYKYHANEDITTIEYKKLRNGDDVVFPELTICFTDPFLNEKLRKIDGKLNRQQYVEYLKGNVKDSDKTFMNIDYEGITFDLFEYLEDVSIFAISGENLTLHSCMDSKNCKFFNLKNNYNGFGQMKTFFARCFGIEINRNYHGFFGKLIIL